MLEILLSSFFLALSGALFPGPLLNYTIYKSFKEKRGYLSTIFILLGHATIELTLILILISGVSFFFENIYVISTIGIIGGSLLVLFGIFSVKDALRFDVNSNLFESSQNNSRYKGNSFIGGILVTLSNPYWEIWWVGAGLGLMLDLNITLFNPIGLIIFFIGHELGDFIWYLPVSTFISFGKKSINTKIYKYILVICGIFMIGFGLYLIFSILYFPPTT
jgi:threonine/homoserine/homoserine lactone efflux protein